MSLIISENNSEETGLGRRNPHLSAPALRNNGHKTAGDNSQQQQTTTRTKLEIGLRCPRFAQHYIEPLRRFSGRRRSGTIQNDSTGTSLARSAEHPVAPWRGRLPASITSP
jgi:hypothetical protein